eukprot:4624448-Amphidinium_carterae.1
MLATVSGIQATVTVTVSGQRHNELVGIAVLERLVPKITDFDISRQHTPVSKTTTIATAIGSQKTTPEGPNPARSFLTEILVRDLLNNGRDF